MIRVRVNGVEQELPDGTTVRRVIELNRLAPERVAIELNKRLLRSDRYETPLKDSDELEIVTFVGGGS